MASHSYAAEAEVALDAVRHAARLCRSVQANIRPETLQKHDRSPVTVADFGSQAVVCHAIESAFRADPVIGEENAAMLREPDNQQILERVTAQVGVHIADVTSEEVLRLIDHGGNRDRHDRFWTLDPIDGTKGFLRKDQYAVALALVDRGAVVVAALACPNLTDETGVAGHAFVAVRGHGTRTAPLFSEGGEHDVNVSSITSSSDARFCESVESGHSSHDDAAAVAAVLGITAESIRLDSQAKYAIVARGDAEIYMRLPTRANYVEKIWDHAAGMLVVEEAGGRVTDIEGRPLDFTHGGRLEANTGVIATNGKVHAAVLAALKSVGVAAATG